MEQISFKVEGMSCSHCKAAVEKALKSTQGVEDAVADLSAKLVKVSYDPGKVSRDVLVRAIQDAGYEVTG